MTPDQIDAREQLELLITQVDDLKGRDRLEEGRVQGGQQEAGSLDARKYPDLAKNLGVKIDDAE
jgi:hypothetical protein